MTTDVPRFTQAAPDAVFREEKMQGEEIDEGEAKTASTETAKQPRWLFALSEEELTPESDTILLWLARFPIENNHPRPLTGRVPAHVAAGEVLTVAQDEKIHKVFKKLVTEGFLGAPVLDSNERYVGFVDMLDLVFFVCEMFRAWFDDVFYVPSEPRLKENWAKFFQLERFKEATVADLMTTAKLVRAKTPSYPAYRGFTTLWAIEEMARLGPHRVPVLDAEHRVHGVLTQSMTISLIDQNLHRLGPLKDMPVREMVPGLASELKVVSEESLAINAFKLMAVNNISGLGVINVHGALTDTISVRDLRGIGTKAEHFERLWHTVANFKAEVRKEFPRQTPPSPITVTLGDTLETVIKRMDDGNIHRVFVVEDREGRKSPLHVVAQRDVLRLLCFKMGMEPIWEIKPLP